VKTFYVLLCICLGFQIGAGIWYLVTFYTTRNQTLSDCLQGTTDQTRIDYCNALQVYKRYPQGYVLAQVIVPIVVQMCKFTVVLLKSGDFFSFNLLDACYVVYHYSRLLNYQDAEKKRQPQYKGPVYQPVNRHDETYPLTHPNMVYPYADGPHSFGSKAV